MAKKTEIVKIRKTDEFEVAICDLNQVSIEPLIRLVRGQQVILDSDLAMLYGVETKRLKEQVNRNMSRFPDDFMFKLTMEEYGSLRSQIATSNKRGGTRYMPYAFTESGIAMLSSVLHSDVAIEVNIRIMRAFTAMRHIMSASAQVLQRLSTIEYHQIESDKHIVETNLRIDEVFRRLDQGAKAKQGLFFEGQIYDAYVFVSDLIKSAQIRIVLVDNYIDESVLTLLDKRKGGVEAKIYTKRITSQLSLDLSRHNAQYAPIDIREYTHSHDRFLIVDDTVYHIGASLKDLGNKLFAFSQMQELGADELLARIDAIT